MNVAVIGTGQMGKNHVRIYSSLKSVKLVAVSDVDSEVLNSVSNTFNIKSYTDYKKMFKSEKIDIISICVPTSLHYKVAKYAIEQGVNVLLEKPITTNVSQGTKLINLSKKHKVKLMVGHVERYNPAIKKLKELIDKGELGKIIAVITRRVGGFPPRVTDANIAVDLAIHDIDLINYLLNDFPNKIIVNKQKNHINRREDSVEFFLKYKKTSAYIQANWVTPVKIRKLNITGTEGYVEMDFVSQQIDFYKSNYNKFKRKFENYSDFVLEFSEASKININIVKEEPLKNEINYFISCVKNNKKLDSSYAVDALKIAKK